MSSKQVIDDIINGLDKLPTLPVIEIKVLEAVQSEKISLQELAETLSTDPSLSAEFLRLTNSPYHRKKEIKVNDGHTQ
jgi:HD-like signal output (HDOD) protein